MSEETKVDEVVVGDAVGTEVDQIEKEEEVILNKKIAALVGNYFRALASISDEELYNLAYTDAGQESQVLLEVVNQAFTGMIAAGGDIPCGHFDTYKKIVSDFNNTLVFNLDAKLEANRDTIIALATGKTDNPDRISHKDIIDAIESTKEVEA